MAASGNILTTLYGECDGYLELRAFRGPSRPREFFKLTDTNGISKFIREHAKFDLYFAVATRKDKSSGKKENVLHVPAVWVDIDFKETPEHIADGLIVDFPLQPTIMVKSGGGYHCYWKLKEPAGPDEIEQVEKILYGLAQSLRGDRASAEAARILRVPNSKNWKYQPPRPVVLTHCNGSEYSLGDFDFLPEPEPVERQPSKKETQAEIQAVMDCAFMAYCRDNAVSLPEPHWYAMITQLVRITGGREQIHLLSKPHPKYKRNQTDAKILHAIDASGPITCDKLKELWECGKNCKVGSPAGLARKMSNMSNMSKVSTNVKECQTNVKRMSNECQTDVKVPEADRVATAIKEWIAINVGIFNASKLFADLGLRDQKKRMTAYKALERLVKSGDIERMPYQQGQYRVRDKSFEEVDLLAQPSEMFDIVLPFSLHTMIETNPKEIILIAGETNAGKTALVFWMMRENAERYLASGRISSSGIYKDKNKNIIDPEGSIGLRYLSSEMGPRAMRKKIDKFRDKNVLDLFVRHVSMGEFIDSPQDKILPSGLTFIDFLEAKDGDFFKLGSQITSIFQSLIDGVAVVAIQKKRGSDIARGGELTHEKPRLVLALSENKERGFFTCKVVKAKHPRDGVINPQNKECDFLVKDGVHLIQISEWNYADKLKTSRAMPGYGLKETRGN